MKRIFLHLSLLLIVFSGKAQMHEWFREDFKDNHRHWLIVDDKNTKSQIDRGKYILESKSATGTWGFYSPYIYFDHKMDFVIETNISFVSGDEKAAFGLMWGLSDINNAYKFNITSEGYYKIGVRRKGVYKDLKPIEKSEFVNGKGKNNTLKIEKQSADLKFFINGNLVHTMPFEPFMGDLFGWNMDSKMQIEVEDIIFNQNKRINLVPDLTYGHKKENLGSSINSAYAEVYPIISSDGKTLYFSVEGDPNNTGGVKDGDEIYYSNLNDDGTWTAKKNIGKPLNNADPNFVVSVSHDNRSLLLGNTYKPDGNTKGEGFSMSYKTDKGWSVPKDLPIKDFYNEANLKTATLSADGNVLIMSLKREHTFGDFDLYYSLKDSSGKWSQPENMGSVINSQGAEICPFLAQDGITLYFSSNGHPGYGDNDLFMAERQGETWDNWNIPQNMGNEINTPHWDAYFSFPDSAEYGYMVSHHNSLGLADIFRMKLPDAVKPEYLRKSIRIKDEFIALDVFGNDITENIISRDANFSVSLKEGFQHEIDLNVTAMSITGKINLVYPDTSCGGILVQLANRSDSVLQYTLPDAECNYVFSDLKPGQYKVIIKRTDNKAITKKMIYKFTGAHPHITRQVYAPSKKPVFMVEGSLDPSDSNLGSIPADLLLVRNDGRIEKKVSAANDGYFVFKNIPSEEYSIAYDIKKPEKGTLSYTMEDNDFMVRKRQVIQLTTESETNAAKTKGQGKISIMNKKYSMDSVRIYLVDSKGKIVSNTEPNETGNFYFDYVSGDSYQVLYEIPDTTVMATVTHNFGSKNSQSKSSQLAKVKMKDKYSTIEQTQKVDTKLLMSNSADVIKYTNMEVGKTYKIDGTSIEPDGFGVQVSAFIVPGNVKRLCDKLAKQGISDVYIQVVNGKGENTEILKFYRVIIGAYQTKDKVKQQMSILNNKGYQTLMRSHDED